MMYFYWKKKGIRPSVFYSMPPGERLMLQAFYQRECEDHDKLVRAANKSGGFICPAML